MTRKDLRSAESDWRATKQPINRLMPKRSNRTFKRLLLGILVVGLFGAACSFLWSTQKHCETVNGSNSRACVD